MISRFADALLAVFNGFRRAEADARHTVSAILAPDRFTVFNSMLLSGHIFAHLPHPMHLSFAVKASALTKIYRTRG